MKLVNVDGFELLCDFSSGVPRPLVPVAQQKHVFDAVHGLAHPGIRALQRLISSRFVWAGCAANVADWCRNCAQCARGKVTCQETTPVMKIAVPLSKFQHVHVDLVGPLPTSADGSAYLMTVLDRTNRWPEAFRCGAFLRRIARLLRTAARSSRGLCGLQCVEY